MDDAANDNNNTSAELKLSARPLADPEMTRLLALIATECDVPVRLLRARSRSRADVAAARRLAMYLLHVVLGRSVTTVAKLFGRHWSTVNRACIDVEDRRDNAAFDVTLSRIEGLLAANQNDPQSERRNAAG